MAIALDPKNLGYLTTTHLIEARIEQRRIQGKLRKLDEQIIKDAVSWQCMGCKYGSIQRDVSTSKKSSKK